MLNPYMTVTALPMRGEPDEAAKFRREYHEDAPSHEAGPAPERPYTRRDPMLLARVWVQIGRFGRVA